MAESCVSEDVSLGRLAAAASRLSIFLKLNLGRYELLTSCGEVDPEAVLYGFDVTTRCRMSVALKAVGGITVDAHLPCTPTD